MKLFTSVTLTLLASTIGFAQTTMCFKENHKSMTTIENTALDGGECKSTLSVNNMKEQGWNVDDIKITTKEGKYNFIYIFKKNQTQSNFVQINTNSNTTDQELENRILKRMEAKKVQEAKEKEIKEKVESKISGKEIYTSKCQSCHGKKAEKRPYNAKSLADLSLEDMEVSLSKYAIEDDVTGFEIIMKPYADMLNSKKTKEVHAYIQSLKTMESK